MAEISLRVSWTVDLNYDDPAEVTPQLLVATVADAVKLIKEDVSLLFLVVDKATGKEYLVNLPCEVAPVLVVEDVETGEDLADDEQ